MESEKPATLVIFVDGTIQTAQGMTWGQLRKIAQELIQLADSQPVSFNAPQVAQEATRED